MATTTSSGSLSGNPDLMRKNLMLAVKGYNEQSPNPNYQRLISGRTITTEQLGEVAAMASGLGLPTVVAEYGAVPSEDMIEVARKTYLQQARKMQFRISDEAFINDQYGIMKGYGKELALAFDVAKEIAAANAFMNFVTGTTVTTTMRAQSLANTAHTISGGLTDSNTFTTQQTLGPIALEAALTALLDQKAEKGYVASKRGPYVLEVATRNKYLAERIVGSDKLAGGNQNDKNALSSDITSVICDEYFTNPEWWCVRVADKDRQPRFMLSRFPFKVTDLTFDQDVDAWKVMAKESYLFDVVDYRGTFYSTPS